eukprot:14365116-Alexandrium_andersonii.AAC.1
MAERRHLLKWEAGSSIAWDADAAPQEDALGPVDAVPNSAVREPEAVAAMGLLERGGHARVKMPKMLGRCSPRS